MELKLNYKEADSLMIKVRDEWLNHFFSCKKIDKEAAIKGVEFLYEVSGLKKPKVIFTDSPLGIRKAVRKYENELGKNMTEVIEVGVLGKVFNGFYEKINKNISFCVSKRASDLISNALDEAIWNNVGDKVVENIFDKMSKEKGGWAAIYGKCDDISSIAYYDFADRIKSLQSPALNQYISFIKSGIYETMQYENICFVCPLPNKILRNEEGRLHSLKESAISWSDGYEIFLVNGREMPKEIFEKKAKGELTKANFLSAENEDIKAGIYELIEGDGEGSMLEFLGAKLVDAQTIVHRNGETETLELYKTKETFEEEEDLDGNMNVPLAWLKMVCPSTNTNYLIPTDSSFLNCTDAAKYHRPNGVPFELIYSWDSRN